MPVYKIENASLETEHFRSGDDLVPVYPATRRTLEVDEIGERHISRLLSRGVFVSKAGNAKPQNTDPLPHVDEDLAVMRAQLTFAQGADREKLVEDFRKNKTVKAADAPKSTPTTSTAAGNTASTVGSAGETTTTSAPAAPAPTTRS